MEAQRLLVTGGTGFIGSALVRRLVEDGRFVRVLDDNSRGVVRRLDGVMAEVDFVKADVRDEEAVAGAARGVDCVVHLAAVNGTENFYKHPELVLDISVRGMLSVLGACRKNGIGNLVFASSAEVYQTAPAVPTDETAPLSVPDVTNARYSYGGGKIIGELMAINYGRTGFERVAVFRPHNVYGPDMGFEHVLPQFALRALDAVAKTPAGPVPFPIQGDGSQTRAFLHIDDLTDGLMTVLAKGAHLEIYHIGNPEEVAIAEVARKVLAYLGREARLIPSPSPAGGAMRRCPDIAKVRALGFEPRITLDQGLPSLIDWYRAHRDQRAAAHA